MHACTRVTTELLPSSRCRQHHLLPRLTTDFLALLPQKARERASMSDARSDGFGQRCFHGRQVGRRLAGGTSSSTSIAVRSSVARRARLGTAPLQWFHLRLDEIRMRRERIEPSQSVLIGIVVGVSDSLDIKRMTLLNATELLAGRQKTSCALYTSQF